MPKERRKTEEKSFCKNLICNRVHASSMVEQNIVDALRIVYRNLKDRKINWVIIGTSSLALQGFDIRIKDIDILTDRSGAFEIGELLREYEIEPVEFGRSEIFESYFGVFRIEGVDVEVMGNMRERIGGRWLSVVQRLDCPKIVELEEMRIPVSSLGEQLMAYERLGREGDRGLIKRIREVLDRRGETEGI